ncbi:hypothetical protein L4D06_20915 [Enterovibrio makurazakiensis]|uniref:KfrA N-terminal DNA-binding domain-containing protein n=1 Tax=Enterovibrio gelatinilyticus TaxID=2899819 RepID=A0ABT5R4M3_9GAMM|nr:hypothetical protein [Enterovibrio sp. ZSDZ42]MDD1795231.1 hypothetical protein [Enterovibrio sp. ZSDZ42]
MSTDFTPILEQAIQSLLREGKNPSVALVKSRLTQPVPMPLIISALQHWKKNGKVPKVELVESKKSSDERIEALEEQVKALTTKLEALEQHLMANS